MLTKERIEALLKEHGYGACFVKQDNNSYRTANPEDWRVIALKGRFRCQIGMFHTIAPMSENELRVLIASKLPKKARTEL